MEGNSWISLTKGILLGALYCAAYWLLWNASFTQWFLPAGLRVAALLLLPYRAWPFIFLGDAAALLILRIPKADDYSVQWAYLSPLLLMPSIALGITAIRRYLRTTESLIKWLPATILAIAIWGSASNMLVNAALSGPPLTVGVLERLLRVSVGYYLGIMLFILPVLLWQLRGVKHAHRKNFFRDVAISFAVTGGIFLTLYLSRDNDPSIRQSLLLLMIVPAAALTYIHGWRGAALSLIASNIGIAQTLPYTGLPGTYDERVFIAQTALVVIGSAILVLGDKISNLYERARELGISERQAQEMTRSSLLIGERNLREQVLYMAQMQVYMEDQRKQLVELLKNQGKFADAMLLNSAAVEHMQSFESRATAIYPLRIEEVGLYGVIFPETFTDFWAGDAEVLYLHAIGKPRTLSVDLQLTAYRCICNAFTLLAQNIPSRFVVKLKTWKRGKYRGIIFKITAEPTQPPQVTRSGAMAEIDLERRVKAYGGSLGRRRLHCVHVLLWEPLEETSTPMLKHAASANEGVDEPSVM
jgi:glucose-6-phosphate-specific signal transduction histidine kinase